MSDKPGTIPATLTPAMRAMLANLAEGRSYTHGLSGRSAHGGAERTLWALVGRALATVSAGPTITPLGLSAHRGDAPPILSRDDARGMLLGQGHTTCDDLLSNAREYVDRGENLPPWTMAVLRAFVAGQAAAPSQPDAIGGICLTHGAFDARHGCPGCAAQPAQGASLEARAGIAVDAFNDAYASLPNSASEEAQNERDKQAWMAVVRAVDASRPVPLTLNCRGCGETDSVEPGTTKVLCHQCVHAGMTHELVDAAEDADPSTNHPAQAAGRARAAWPTRGCCGEFETGSNHHDPECENAGEEDQ